MDQKNSEILKKIEGHLETWIPPRIESVDLVPTGDMPGDQIKIENQHIENAHELFKPLLKTLKRCFEVQEKVVISVHGGSGVGKSETGALIAYYLNDIGIGTYILSGDNYPRRIPQDNDAERYRVYKNSGLKELVNLKLYNKDVKESLSYLWTEERDADPEMVKKYPWLLCYQNAGKKGLKSYLGTEVEIEFERINHIVHQFKIGNSHIYLKRMGRKRDELYYELIDFSERDVLIIEWTHGNNEHLMGVDVPILLNSTPEETLAHRKKRNRDGKIDSAFTSTVLELEQALLISQSKNAQFILTKSGTLIDYESLIASLKPKEFKIGPMFNAYPDSIGGELSGTIEMLKHPLIKDAFDDLYILPSVFNTDLDRGFSVINYDLNQTLSKPEDFHILKNMGIGLKFDFILNHASVLSPQFQDIIKQGKKSKYVDFFIDWNQFWSTCGPMLDGVIHPEEKYIKDMFFRKSGLPVLKVRMPDGEEVPYWNTFYQEVNYPSLDPQDIMNLIDVQYYQANLIAEKIKDGLKRNLKPGDIEICLDSELKNKIISYLENKRHYLGQMDLNIQSPLVWDFYEETLRKLSEYGAEIVRLDAFAYAPKSPGKRNFLNDPETWEVLSRINLLAKTFGLKILPEIHAKYEEGIHSKISKEGYLSYDFFLPGLIIDAFERKDTLILKKWIQEILDNKMTTVNMLGCHDGIPLLDLKGLLTENQIQNLIKIVVDRGGHVKDLHGKENVYYQVNATYYSALGEDENRLLLARALQMFMPGKPQVWYLDLLAGTNDYEAIRLAGPSGHKEINRSNLSMDEAFEKMKTPLVKKQLELITLRRNHLAFNLDAQIRILPTSDHTLSIEWQYAEHLASIELDFTNNLYKIVTT
jgi:glycosidase